MAQAYLSMPLYINLGGKYNWYISLPSANSTGNKALSSTLLGRALCDDTQFRFHPVMLEVLDTKPWDFCSNYHKAAFISYFNASNSKFPQTQGLGKCIFLKENCLDLFPCEDLYHSL